MRDLPQQVQFEVEGLGKFGFRPRTVGNELEIQRLITEKCRGNADEVQQELRAVATMYAEMNVLLGQTPPGWKLDNELVVDLMKVYSAFRVAETRFQDGLSGATQAKS